MRKQKIIAIEGIDGAGKSTLCKRLCEMHKYEPVYLYNRTKKGRIFRSMLNIHLVKKHKFLQVPIYILMAHVNLLRFFLNYCICFFDKPGLVVMDRCFLSNFSYYYPSAMNGKLQYHLAILFEPRIKPDIIFLIDEDPAIARRRDNNDKELGWLKYARNNYLKAVKTRISQIYKIIIVPKSLTIGEKTDFIENMILFYYRRDE